MHRILYAPAILLILASASSRGEEPMTFRFKEGKNVASVTFELNNNKIFFPLRFNGGEPRWFVLDSGCSRCRHPTADKAHFVSSCLWVPRNSQTLAH